MTELPRVEPQVTEYRRHCLSCLVCGAQTAAAWPSDMPAGDFGPRLQASTAYLTGRLGLSQRDAAEALETLYHTDVGLGSIPSLEQAVSTALEQPVNEAQTYVQQQPVANVDETGWRQQSKRAWLWLAAAPRVAVFLVLPTRGARTAPVAGRDFSRHRDFGSLVDLQLARPAAAAVVLGAPQTGLSKAGGARWRIHRARSSCCWLRSSSCFGCGRVYATARSVALGFKSP